MPGMTTFGSRPPLRAADIKERNERLVLGMVFRSGGASQSEVALRSGLKAPTVFRIFGELEKAGLISPLQTPPPKSPDKKGRRPTWFGTVPAAYRVVGLDFRAGGAAVVVEDFTAKILRAEERAIPEGADALEAYRIVSGLAEDAINGTEGGPILGIGVGAPGVVDLANGTVAEYKRIRGLSGFPLAQMLSERFDTEVRLNNNATVATVAAFRYGRNSSAAEYTGADGPAQPSAETPSPISSAFSLLVRAGVGGAFIREGKPYENAGRTAIEIGHMTMDPHGPSCPCGQDGCLEAYLAEEALVAAAAKVARIDSFEALDRALSARDERVVGALAPPFEMASNALLTIRHLLDPGEFMIISRSEALSGMIAAEAERHMALRPRPDGSSPRVRGYRWDPILAGKAACDMILDWYFD